MKKKTQLLTYVASITVISALTLPSQAFAQDQDVDEIIVTAKQRTQNLQEVALPITVLVASDLIERNILDAKDVAAFTPNFNFASGSGRGDPTAVSVRGVAPNTSDERFQGVSFFVDGVPLSGQLGGIDITQLEQIEIIKGPQSAQFGRATYSGAINYITKNPVVDELEASVRFRLGSTKGSDQASYYTGGRISFPIIQDKVWGSINVNERREGAFDQNISVGTDVGREDTTSWGAVLYAEPTPNWDVKLRYSRDAEDDSESSTHLIHPREFTGTNTLINGQTLVTDVLPDPVLGVLGGDPRSNSPAGNPIDPTDGGTERTRTLYSLITGYNFDNDYRLEYKGAYYEQKRNQSGNFANRDALNGTTVDPVFLQPFLNGELRTPLSAGFNNFEFQEDFENMSHQILLLSPGDEQLRWQIGGYYFEEESRNFRRHQGTATNPDGLNRGFEKFENIALFGSVAYDINDKLTAEFEGRYQEEEAIFEACDFCQLRTTDDFVEKETDFLPRITLDYQATDNNLLYGLYSKGLKSGRITRVLSGRGFAYASPERLDNFEIGAKNTFMDGRGVLNIALFYADVEDQQLVSTAIIDDPDNPGMTTQVTAANNVGNSDVLGFEIEGAFDVTDNFEVSAGFGLSDQSFKGTDPITGLSSNLTFTLPAENNLGGGAFNLDGLTQANIPTTTGNASARYIHALNNDMNVVLRADATYRGKFYADLGNNTEVRSAWKANLRATLETELMDVSLYARNVFNQDRATSVGLGGSLSFCRFNELDTAAFGSRQRCYTAAGQRPREIGVELTADF